MSIELVFETHSTTLDNEAGIATGWLPGELAPSGETQAAELGSRRRTEHFDAVFCSDLRRARQTVSRAFQGSLPVFLDWRLRECDYGDLNRAPVSRVHTIRTQHLDVPYPAGESWRQAVQRVGGTFEDLRSRWDSARLLVVGHLATRWALDHLINGIPLERLAAEQFVWQPGWTYHLESHW